MQLLMRKRLHKCCVTSRNGRGTEQVKPGQVNLDHVSGHFRGHFHERLRGRFRGELLTG